MKLKTISIIILTLILLTPIIIQNQNIITPISMTTTPATKNTPITGQGADTNATLIITGNITSPGQADTESGFNISCPQGWGILNTTLTITNITAPNATIKQGDRKGTLGVTLFTNIPFTYTTLAMSFPVSTINTIVYNVSCYLQVQYSGALLVYIMNATMNTTLNRLVPDKNVTNKISYSNATFKRGWLNLSLNNAMLNASNTVNNTFFVVLESNGIWAEWFYVDDEEPYNDGEAYAGRINLTDGSFEVGLSIPGDFLMNVFLSYGPAYPSEVGLKIEGASVLDFPGKRGVGNCTINGPFESQDGIVHFDASSSWNDIVYFNVSKANSVFYRKINATTTYAVAISEVKWNVTIDATEDHGFPDIGSGMFINVSIPADWWNITPGALNSDTGEERVYLVNAPGMLLFEAANGTWIIQCRGPNVLSFLTIYSLYEGFSPVNVSGAVVGDNLTVRGALTATLSGKANLTVLKDGGKVFENQTVFSGGTVDVGWFNVSVEPGSYVVRLLVECGLEVGLIEQSSFSISDRAPCSIRIDRLESTDRVRILFYVSRNDTGFPVTNAEVRLFYVDGGEVGLDKIDNYRNGSYFVEFTLPGGGFYKFKMVVWGSHIEETYRIVELSYSPPPLPLEVVAEVLAFMAQSAQSVQFSRLLALLGVSAAVVVAGGVAGGRVYRRWRAPVKALSSIENVLVTHRETGLPLWSFDVLSLDVDATLVSGFVSAVRSFAEEMRLGGFNVLETRIGTFVRAESELLEVVCVAGKVGKLEVEWLRGRLAEFLRLVEAEAGSALRKWEGGDVSEFRDVFRRAFNSVFNYPRLLKLHEARMRGLIKEKSRLMTAIASLEKEAKKAGELLDKRVLSVEEYERRISELSREKETLEQRIASIDDTLSRIRVRELIITGKIEEVRARFNEIRSKIEEFRVKEERGELTDKERKKLRALEKELKRLIDELGKIETGGA